MLKDGEDLSQYDVGLLTTYFFASVVLWPRTFSPQQITSVWHQMKGVCLVISWLFQRMKQKLFWMSILFSNSLADECILSPWSCLPEGNNLLESHHNVSTTEECHQLCRNHSSCTHFTHYNSDVAASLASTCLLLSSCSSKNTNCHGCWSGTRECNPTCNLPKSTGGLWFCSHNNTVAVGSEECFFTCGTRMVVATCLSGNNWDVDINTRQFECPCPNPPAGVTTLTCTSEPSPVDPSYPGGTVCR